LPCRTDRIAVLTAATYLTEPARGDYNAHTSTTTHFIDWAIMKVWLLHTFNPADAENTYLVHCFTTFSKEKTRPLMHIINALMMRPTSCVTSCQTTMFVFTSQISFLPYYKIYSLFNTELARWEKPLDAMVLKIKRLPIFSFGSNKLTHSSIKHDLGSRSATLNSSCFNKK
jgi:hypothetical protein